MSFELDKLYHVSENGNIALFKPRPSPSYFEKIKGNVVFTISGRLLHNYLFPRNCPRVTYYIGETTSQHDKEKFFGQTSADYVIAIEAGWLKAVQEAKLYCYEFSSNDFIMLDECAGYYISYQQIMPLSVRLIPDVFGELVKRNIELRILPNLWKLATAVVASSLSFSLIRMRNAKDNRQPM